MSAYCPATMCPMFARAGSPWTGEVNAHCDREKCAWWQGGKCIAPEYAMGDLPERPTRKTLDRVPRCPRAHECQWQIQAEWLCPPRFAVVNGMDPRLCAY